VALVDLKESKKDTKSTGRLKTIMEQIKGAPIKA